MLVGAVLDGLGAAVGELDGLRVYGYLADQVAPPAAVCTVEAIEYDATMSRGADRGTFLVHVLVGRADARSARNALDPYLAGAGSSSVKEAVEADPTLGGAVSSTRVLGATVVVMSVGGIDYLAATFAVDVIA